MSAKKEKLIKITKDRDGSEVRVYKEYDQENPYFSGGLRFVHKENDKADEVEMQPFEINIDELKRLKFSIKALLDKPKDYKEPEKKSFNSKKNFNKYTLVGYGSFQSGCNTPTMNLSFKKINKIIFINATVSINGLCKGYFYSETWHLIPKIKKNEDVNFKVCYIYPNQ